MGGRLTFKLNPSSPAHGGFRKPQDFVVTEGEHRWQARRDGARTESEAASIVAGRPTRGPAACPAAEGRDVRGGQEVRLDQAAWRTISTKQ